MIMRIGSLSLSEATAFENINTTTSMPSSDSRYCGYHDPIIIAVFNKVGVTAFFGQNQNFASLIALKVILL
jgi:hypothetical protein